MKNRLENDRTLQIIKMFAFAAIGIFFFFITITVGGKSSIPLDHLVTFFKNQFPQGIKYYAFIVILGGGIYPFIKGSWKQSNTEIIFSILKLFGIVFAAMYVFHIGPEFLLKKDMLPFLYDKLAISIGLIVPLGAICLSFLIDYGLLELVGVFMQPIMRKIWKTPGKSAIDAIASFVGSYSIGLLITGKVYKNGGYSFKEAAIIATGFSTVSVTFMIIIAKTLDLMSMWSIYFWTTIIITFIVTAITARIYPIKKMQHHEIKDKLNSKKSNTSFSTTFNIALENGLKIHSQSGNVLTNIKSNFIAGFIMTMSILASIMSIGAFGLILVNYTPLFDLIGVLFYPFAWITNVPDAMEFSKALASSLAEMFLPALILKDADIVSKFTAAIASVSSILFFSASIPCILATGIPIKIKDLIIIWAERMILTILIAVPIVHLLNYLGLIS